MAEDLSERVRARFARGAARYPREALLQRAVAWRLVRMIRDLPLPPGPCADLGAGSGAVAEALGQLAPRLWRRQPLQLDLTAALLARNPLAARRLLWNLNHGLPPGLAAAALLTSSFALQWLEHPAAQLALWCRTLAPAGVLALALPTAASFPQWHQAAERSGVPCTALPLPRAEQLVAVVSGQLDLLHCRRLRFSRAASALALLRQMRAIGADASPAARLSGSQLRRLLRAWPAGPTTWEVLLLVARRP